MSRKEKILFRDLSFMGYPAYGIDTSGAAYSKLKMRSKGYARGSEWIIGDSWKKLKPSVDNFGYPSIGVTHEKRSKRFRIHELVLLAFVGPRPSGKIARHFPDRSPTNNQLSNLSWSDPWMNQKDREYQGSRCHGSDFSHAKLDETKVQEIRELYRQGKGSMRMIAEMYGVCTQSIHLIINRVTWKHVP